MSKYFFKYRRFESIQTPALFDALLLLLLLDLRQSLIHFPILRFDLLHGHATPLLTKLRIATLPFKITRVIVLVVKLMCAAVFVTSKVRLQLTPFAKHNLIMLPPELGVLVALLRSRLH